MRCLYTSKSQIIETNLHNNDRPVSAGSLICSVSFCPIPTRVPYARLSVGDLDDQERDEVEERSAFSDRLFVHPPYVLHCIDVAEQGIEHRILLDRFKQKHKEYVKADTSGAFNYWMLRYFVNAANVRDLFKGTSESESLEVKQAIEQMSGPAETTQLSADAKHIIATMKQLKNYREPKPIPTLSLKDLKPPIGTVGKWINFRDVLDILCDDKQKKRTREQKIKHLADRRSPKAERVLDKETGYLHGKDSKGVFFRHRESKKPDIEYFILDKSHQCFASDYPKAH